VGAWGGVGDKRRSVECGEWESLEGAVDNEEWCFPGVGEWDGE